jgi:sulfite reductase beta subunit-like hemoprotein
MPTLVFPSQVRDQILQQHVELRGLLARAIADTAPAPSRSVDSARLATTARELCARFKAHLAFENEELARVLHAVDSWGPERVRALHDEHARQRLALDAVLAKLEEAFDVDELAGDLRALATNLVRDMEEEEAGCLSHTALSAHVLPCERC